MTLHAYKKHNETVTTNRRIENPPESQEATKAAPSDDSQSSGSGNDNGSNAGPSEFNVYFINVGQGDASLIVCDGHVMLIDGGPSSQSDTIYSFLKTRKISHLDYVVATHPDEDHIGGIAGALNAATVGTALSSVKNDDSTSFQNLVKYLDRQGVGITVPTAGERFSLGSAEVIILGPIERSDKANNNSIVLKVVHGKNSFIFTGDAEVAEEESILRSGVDVKSTVLKVSHHGSASSTSEQWIKAVQPSIAVISCGKDNDYGHPTKEVLDRIKNNKISLYRTDLQGFIKVYEDGERLVCRTEQNAEAAVFEPGVIPVKESQTAAAQKATEAPVLRIQENDSSKQEMNYVANKNSKKFHYPSCESVKEMKEKNRLYFTGYREDLIAQGYEPCKNCHP